MSFVLEIREKLKGIFSRYEYWIIAVFKAVLALVAVLFINKNLGQFAAASNPLVIAILVLISAILPLNGVIVLLGILILVHLYAISLLMCGVGLVFFLFGLALVFRFERSDVWGVLFTPLALHLNLGPAVPVLFGLRGTPFSIAGVAYGGVLYYFLLMVRDRAAKLTGPNLQATAEQMGAFATALLQNKEMILMIIILSAVLLVVYMIGRSPFDYAWSIATGVGLALYLIMYYMGMSTLKLEPKQTVILAVILSGLMAVVLQLLVFNLDYSRTEQVTFEDEDYVYYVKAVPKNSIAVRKKQVNRINVRQNEGMKREEE